MAGKTLSRGSNVDDSGLQGIPGPGVGDSGRSSVGPGFGLRSPGRAPGDARYTDAVRVTFE